MMYLPSEEIQRYMDEVNEWYYFDEDEKRFKLRPDAPEDIKRKQQLIKKDLDKNMIFK